MKGTLLVKRIFLLFTSIILIVPLFGGCFLYDEDHNNALLLSENADSKAHPDPGQIKDGTAGQTRGSSRAISFGNETAVYELDVNSDLIIQGVDKWDAAGQALATGDIDGDGVMDLIISAAEANSGPSDDRYSAGEIYVVFGGARTSFTSPLDLSSSASR